MDKYGLKPIGSAGAPYSCVSSIAGMTYHDTTANSLLWCDGSGWIEFAETDDITIHNNLGGLQGGQATEYFHFTDADHTELSEWLDDVILGSDGSYNSSNGMYLTGSTNYSYPATFSWTHKDDDQTYMYFNNDMDDSSYAHGVINLFSKNRIGLKATANATGALPAVGLQLEAHSNKPGAGGALGIPLKLMSYTYDDSVARGIVLNPVSVAGSTGEMTGTVFSMGALESAGTENPINAHTIDPTVMVNIANDEQFTMFDMNFDRVQVFDMTQESNGSFTGLRCHGTSSIYFGMFGDTIHTQMCINDTSNSDNYMDNLEMNNTVVLNTVTGGNAGSDLCIDANNQLCACGSCA